MRAPVSWLRELVDIPPGQSGRDIAERLVRAGLEVESVERIGDGVEGELVLGRVAQIEELTEFKKPIRWCQVDVGEAHGSVRGIICGARNFAVGDLVVVALPGTVLPGGFEIAARATYGKVSNGMICSERELAIGEDHDGIMVLPAGAGEPGQGARELLGIGDEVLDIAVTPDRGYALSMRGLARELAIAYGVPFADPGLALADLPAPDPGGPIVECGTQDLGACALFTLRTIVGFDPTATSPTWMRRRLIACGMRPVSLAVDVTNYVMVELGQPLHAFDLAKLQGSVRASRAEPGASLQTLDHVTRTLDADDLVICDDSGPIGLAGTMGGALTEVDETTTGIALEAAWFDPTVVARMSRRHRLSSEASRRFERGVDRNLAPYASARAAALLLSLGGGTYLGMTAVEGPDSRAEIAMQATEPATVSGIAIPADTSIELLAAIGCQVRVIEGELHVIPPSWRLDLTDPADLVEEVVRLVGYENLPSTLPTAALGHGLTDAQRLRRRVGMALAARGAVEVLTYPFVGDTEQDSLRIDPHDPRRSTVRLANPLSDEQPYLRATLLPGLLAAARRNLSRGADAMVLFECGSVVRGGLGSPIQGPPVGERPSDAQWAQIESLLPLQSAALAAVLCGEAEPAGWWGQGRAVDWSDAVTIAVTVGHVLGLQVGRTRGEDPSFHPGRCARILVDGERVGVAGELHPGVIQDLGLAPRTCAVELDLDAMIERAPQIRPAPEVITTPVAKEDIALIVPDAVDCEQVMRALAQGAGPLLESIRLFDVYRGAQIPDGSRSLAFAMRFRSAEGTLEASQIASAREAAVARAKQECGAVLRG